MPPLPNLKHEVFAQELARGTTQTDAWEIAGYAMTSTGGPSALAKDKRIVARVTELLAKVAKAEEKAVTIVAKKLALSKEKVLEELCAIAFGNIGDVAEWSGKEIELYDKSQLSRETMTAIASIKCKDGSIEIKMHDKLTALDKIARHLGVLVPEVQPLSVDVDVNVEVTDLGSAREIFLGRMAGIAARFSARSSTGGNDRGSGSSAAVGLAALGPPQPTPTR